MPVGFQHFDRVARICGSAIGRCDPGRRLERTPFRGAEGCARERRRPVAAAPIRQSILTGLRAVAAESEVGNLGRRGSKVAGFAGILVHGELNGWSESPWIKAGWFQSFLLLAGHWRNLGRKEAARDIASPPAGCRSRPDRGRVQLERDLVQALDRAMRKARGWLCGQPRILNRDYTPASENIAFECASGLNSYQYSFAGEAEDFPGNGWLQISVFWEAIAAPRGNCPIAGFRDETDGSLHALGGSAYIPAPNSSDWIAKPHLGRGNVVAGKARSDGPLAARSSCRSSCRFLCGAGRVKVVGSGLPEEPRSHL